MVKAEIRGKSLLTWFYPMPLYSAAPRALAGGKMFRTKYFSVAAVVSRGNPMVCSRCLMAGICGKSNIETKENTHNFFLVELILETEILIAASCDHNII